MGMQKAMRNFQRKVLNKNRIRLNSDQRDRVMTLETKRRKIIDELEKVRSEIAMYCSGIIDEKGHPSVNYRMDFETMSLIADDKMIKDKPENVVAIRK